MSSCPEELSPPIIKAASLVDATAYLVILLKIHFNTAKLAKMRYQLGPLFGKNTYVAKG